MDYLGRLDGRGLGANLNRRHDYVGTLHQPKRGIVASKENISVPLKKPPNNLFFILKDRMPLPSTDLLKAAKAGKAVFNLAGKDVVLRNNGRPLFGGALQQVSRMLRKRGNVVIYHDLGDNYDDFHAGAQFPPVLRKHFSGAIVAKGFTMIDPQQSKAARYLDPSLVLADKTSLERGRELANKTWLQRGMVCCRWQFPEYHQVLIVKRSQDDEGGPTSAQEAQLGCSADTYYEVFDQEAASIEEQTIFFLACALGEAPSEEEREVLGKLLDKFNRASS